MHISEAPQKDFKVFLANRVQKIEEHSDVNQWNYVEGKDHPADDASRGLDPGKETSSSRWFTGPPFLWQRKELWPNYNEVTCVRDDEPEIKKDVKVNAVQIVNDVSKYDVCKRIIALVSKSVSQLVSQSVSQPSSQPASQSPS